MPSSTVIQGRHGMCINLRSRYSILCRDRWLYAFRGWVTQSGVWLPCLSCLTCLCCWQGRLTGFCDVFDLHLIATDPHYLLAELLFSPTRERLSRNNCHKFWLSSVHLFFSFHPILLTRSTDGEFIGTNTTIGRYGMC